MIQSVPPSKVALVLGATGGVGGAVTQALLARGWHVKALHRHPERATLSLPGLDWIKGDAMSRADVVQAACDAALIVHAVNPPGYQRWSRLQAPMLENTIAAAQAAGARILLPGSVYNFGPDAGDVLTETSAQHPQTRKGAIKTEMEKRLQASGVKTLVVRAGDFFGPGATANSWFSQLIKPGRPIAAVTYPGAPDVGHAWAYLPDLGETMAALADREADLETFSVFHFGGHWMDRGEAMVEAIIRVADRPAIGRRRFPWTLVIALSPFVPLFRELLEMRYLWLRPLKLDNAKLRAFLGAEIHTPLPAAVAEALTSLGCLKADWPLEPLTAPKGVSDRSTFALS